MGVPTQIPPDCFSALCLSSFSSSQYRFPFHLDFQILPQNDKVEPRNLCSTLSFASCSFSPLAPIPPSFPPFLNFGVNHVSHTILYSSLYRLLRPFPFYGTANINAGCRSWRWWMFRGITYMSNPLDEHRHGNVILPRPIKKHRLPI
jgi:hypothetical protein